MDLGLYQSIKKSLINRLDRANNFTYKVRPKEYYDAIERWYKERHLEKEGIVIRPEYILESPSVATMIYITVKYFSKKGDKVLALTPIWTAYRNITEHLGRKFIPCKMYSSREKKGSFRYDVNFSDF